MKQNDIILIKLSTNEEIIATLVEEFDHEAILKRPRVLMPMEAKNGQVGLVLIPWMMGSQDPSTGFESDIALAKNNIIGKAIEPPKALVDMYIQKTTGLQLITG